MTCLSNNLDYLNILPYNKPQICGRGFTYAKRPARAVAAGADHGVSKLSCINKKVLFQRWLRELRIHRSHLGLHLVALFVGDWCYRLVVPRELHQVLDGFDARLLHGLAAALSLHDVVCHPTGDSPGVTVSAVVAALNHQQIDVTELIEVFPSRYSDFAHELRIAFVSGQAFFDSAFPPLTPACSASCFICSSTTFATPYHSLRSSTMDVIRSLRSCGVDS